MGTDTPWAFLDTETDGLYGPIHVVEVAAQRMIGTVPDGAPFQTFINHDVPIPREVTAIHGYTREFLAANGIRPDHAHTLLRNYIGDRPIAAHYIRFDWDMALLPEWNRLGIPPIGRRGICTWALSRRVIHETASHRLDILRNHFGLRGARAHSAIGDIEATTELLTRIIFPRLAKIGLNTYEQIAEFSAMRPLGKCLCLIQGRDYEQEQRERNRIENLLDLVGSGSDVNFPRLILEENLVAEEPEIRFHNRVFLFTGKMKWGSRTKAQDLVAKLGGRLAKSKSVSADVDYLVLGEDPEKGWTQLLQGGKLQGAFEKKLRSPNSRLNIITETDFIAAINAA